MDNEIIKIHIWELPEKTDAIDKSNDYTLIHDGKSLKKISIEKLYEYFGQDYKIENLVKYFETLLETENKKYEPLYYELESSTNSYTEIIQIFQDSFADNKNKIRDIEASLNYMNRDSNDLLDFFKILEASFIDLNDNLIVLRSDITNIESRTDIVTNDIIKLNDSVYNMNNMKDDVTSNNSSIVDSVVRISNNINTEIDNRGEELSKNINDAYDTIVSIIDKYHHIHE